MRLPLPLAAGSLCMIPYDAVFRSPGLGKSLRSVVSSHYCYVAYYEKLKMHHSATLTSPQRHLTRFLACRLQRRSLRLKEQTEARAERARLDRLRAQQREEQLVARFTGPSPPPPPPPPP